MKKQVYLLLSAIIIVLITISAILFSYNRGLNNRIDTLSKSVERISLSDSTYISIEVDKMRFKEDYYIQQQSKDTTLILTVFGLLTIVFGYFSFNSFRKEVENVVNEVKEDYNIYVKKYEDEKHKLVILENKVNYQMSMFYFDYAKSVEDIKSFDYTFFRLKGCAFLAKILVNPIDENEQFISAIQSIIDENITELSRELLHEIYISENEVNTEMLKTIQETISKVVDNKNYQLLNQIFSKIKVT